jgi:hypothetical protein
MKFFVELTLTDGTKRIEALFTEEETSHYRLKQRAIKEFPNVADAQVYEDKWKKADKKNYPTENWRPVVYIDTKGNPQMLLFGWSDEDVQPIKDTSAWWIYVDFPSLPAELEGSN